jgi:hypothetical protein
VGIGESRGEGFAPGEMPGSMATAGHVAQILPDSQCDECGAITWADVSSTLAPWNSGTVHMSFVPSRAVKLFALYFSMAA